MTGNHNYKSFTIEYNNIARALISPIGITEAFDPQKVPKSKKPVLEKTQAIWDTGATNSVISEKLVQKLNLKPTGQTTTRGVNSSQIVNTYLINVTLPNSVSFTGVRVSEGKLDFGILIGMDIITVGDFAVSNQGKTVMTFRLPSKGRIDFARDQNEEILSSISRNDIVEIQERSTGDTKETKWKKAKGLVKSGKWVLKKRIN